MIGLDTNVLVRFLAQDDPRQSALASELIESLSEQEPGFVSLVALVETTWVLHRAYGQTPARIRTIVAGLLDSTELVVERSDVVRAALSMDAQQFSDALIAELGKVAGADETVTFDRRAATLRGMRLLS